MARLEKVLHGSTLVSAWRDSSGKTHRIEATFDRRWLESTSAQRIRISWEKVAAVVESAAQQWASSRGFRVSVTPSEGGSGVELQCSGSSLPTQREIDAHLDQLIVRAVCEQGFRKELTGGFSPDIRYAAFSAAPYLNPLVRSLRSDSDALDAKSYLSKALSFTQLIPYVANSQDFLLPAGVLFNDRGDCDEKAALLLSLFWAAYPREPAIEVRIPDHLIIGFCGIDTSSTISAFGRRWAGCEAAGPAQLRLGEVSLAVTSALRNGSASLRQLHFSG